MKISSFVIIFLALFFISKTSLLAIEHKSSLEVITTIDLFKEFIDCYDAWECKGPETVKVNCDLCVIIEKLFDRGNSLWNFAIKLARHEIELKKASIKYNSYLNRLESGGHMHIKSFFSFCFYLCECGFKAYSIRLITKDTGHLDTTKAEVELIIPYPQTDLESIVRIQLTRPKTQSPLPAFIMKGPSLWPNLKELIAKQ